VLPRAQSALPHTSSAASTFTAHFSYAAALMRKKPSLLSEYEYVARHPESADNTSSIRIKIDPVTATTFEALKLPPALVHALHTHFPEVKAPTIIQRNMLALLQSDLSVLVRADPGTGKSLATALYLLSFGRAGGSSAIKSGTPGPHVTSLLLVPTAELAVQYYRVFCQLLADSPVDVNSIVQHIYRADASGEARQLELLRRAPGPAILVATPKRVLDILASADDRAALPLNALSTIVLDEVHQLLPNDRRILAAPGRGSRLRHAATVTDAASRTPTQILLDHIVPWRNKNVLDNNELFTPLRFIFESSVASGLYKHLAIKSKWLSTRPMLGLGLDGIGGEYKRRLPAEVDNYFVTYDQSVPLLRDTNLTAVDPELLRDATFLESVADLNGQRQRELLREARTAGKTTAPSPDAASNNHATSKNTAADKAKAARAAQLTDYACGLAELIKANSSKAVAAAAAEKKGLVIVPNSFSIPQFAAELWRVAGLRVATSNPASSTGLARVDPAPGASSSANESALVEVDPQTIFIESESSSSSTDTSSTTNDVDLLVYRAKGVAGLDFPGLRNVYVLSWDSLLSTKLYLSVAGRCRPTATATTTATVASNDAESVNSETKEPSTPSSLLHSEPNKLPRGKVFVLSLANEESKEHAFRLGVSMGKINSFPNQFF
jgi:hypothetical protein